MLRRQQILDSVLLCAIPAVRRRNAASAGVRRPGGGAGLDYKDYDAATA